MSDRYLRGCNCKLLVDEESAAKTNDNEFQVSGLGEVLMSHAMEDVCCASSSLESGVLPDHSCLMNLRYYLLTGKLTFDLFSLYWHQMEV